MSFIQKYSCYGLLALTGMISSSATAQQTPAFTLKVDLAAPLHRAAGGAISWNLNQRTGLECRMQQEWHPYNSDEVFQGVFVNHYVERRLDTVLYILPYYPNVGEKYFVGNGRPLPVPPGGRTPLSTWSNSIGYRLEYGQKWRWFLQPSLLLSRHRYMQLQDVVSIENEQTDVWDDPVKKMKIVQASRTLRQERTMHIRSKWFGGIRYDMGVAHALGERFSLEARAAAALQIGTPYTQSAPPPVRPFSLQYHLMLGYGLGKR